jgi:hypothetical protein
LELITIRGAIMKKLIIGLGLLAVLALLLASVSCAREAAKESPPQPPPAEQGPPVLLPPAESGSIWGSGTDEGKGPLVLVNTQDTDQRMIVRSGDISLVVGDVTQVMQAITQLAAGYDGYVVSSSVSGEEEGMRGWISLRIPDDRFDQALAEIRGLAVRVEQENTSSQDVTEEYIDLEARLANAEATEQEFLALLDKAQDVEDILKIYSNLSQIRQDIEQLKGRMQYLERTSSMSLISASLRPEFSEKPPVPPGWSALEIFKSAARGLVITGQVLGTIAIWLLIFIPIWGTALGITLWRLHKRRVRV